MNIDGIEIDCNNSEYAVAVLQMLLDCMRPYTTPEGVASAGKAMEQIIERYSKKMTPEGLLWLTINEVFENYKANVLSAVSSDKSAVKHFFPSAVCEKEGQFFTVVDTKLGNRLGPSCFSEEKAWKSALERIAAKVVES
jgi:hypothetical protein